MSAPYPKGGKHGARDSMGFWAPNPIPIKVSAVPTRSSGPKSYRAVPRKEKPDGTDQAVGRATIVGEHPSIEISPSPLMLKRAGSAIGVDDHRMRKVDGKAN